MKKFLNEEYGISGSVCCPVDLYIMKETRIYKEGGADAPGEGCEHSWRALGPPGIGTSLERGFLGKMVEYVVQLIG